MVPARRDFMMDLLTAGLLPALSPVAEAANRLLQQPGITAQLPEVDPEAIEFWTDFLRNTTTPPSRLRGNLTRGTTAGLEREAFYFHYGRQGLQPAMDIPPTELLPQGDAAVSVNVVAFRPADEDRNTFERLQNAQLRLDFVQSFPILDVIDTMAWTALAALHPDRTKKLPPIQNLSFDPGATWQKMQNIVLPGGQGLWAVNLYAQRKASFFTQLLQVVTKEIDRFAPVLGLPAISTSALQSFNAFYGAVHSSPEYLFKSNPVPVFATSSALKNTVASRGIPLRTGTYVLVPIAHAERLTAVRLDDLEMRLGLMVPKNTRGTEVYSAAVKTLPDVTYATIDVTVKPSQVKCPGSPREALR